MAKKSAKRVKVAAGSLQVPQNLEDAAAQLGEIGKLQREIEARGILITEVIERLKRRNVPFVEFRQEKIDALFQGIFAYAQAHRDDLTDGGKRKTVAVSTGEIGWRNNTPSTRIKDAEAVLQKMIEEGRDEFIRRNPTIDREAMLKNPEEAACIPGVTINPGEEMFFAKPSDTSLEVEGGVKKLKKLVE